MRLCLTAFLSLLALIPAQGEPFQPTPPIDITGKREFSNPQNLNDEAAAQLKGLCSSAEFSALPAEERHVYAFEPWPIAKDDLETKTYCFNFRFGTDGAQKVAFQPGGGGPGGTRDLVRAKDPASSRYFLQGFGNLSWSGRLEQVFRFDKPVKAFGVVLNSVGNTDLIRFAWKGAPQNGYPVYYTLSDGSIVQLGQRNTSGAIIKANTDFFVGVIDRSGLGIVSVSFVLKGLAGNVAQGITMREMVFASLPSPPVAPAINLRASHDFHRPSSIADTPEAAAPGVMPLSVFRDIVGTHRAVYRFNTWPQALTGEFSFDLRGKGEVGEKITIRATNASGAQKLMQATLKDEESVSYPVLGGLGEIGNGAWAEQTFHFSKPVWAFGLTYRSRGNIVLEKSGGFPVSYTLSDGAIVNLGSEGAAGGTITAGQKTFVGVMDYTDKGIASVTVRLKGGAAAPQPLYIEDLAFALAGPPPGDWKMTLNENFDGDRLDPNVWTPGYTFPDVINQELQGYVPENISVANGICTIKVEQRPCVNTDREGRTGGKQQFASGAFTSFDKFTQTYGYFEARIKMPKARGAGIWPAFWSLPDRGREYLERLRKTYRTKEYGNGLEIDIFEFMPRWKRVDGTFPIHVGCIWSYGKVTEADPAPHGYGSYALENDGWGPGELYLPNLDSQFHTYGLYWSPERLIFYVDGKPIFRVKDPRHVPDVPQYFLFNVAMSRNGWGRSPDKKHPTMEEIIQDMPNQMEIDYFRAYSGTLDEPIPPSPNDLPKVRKYNPPPKDAQISPPAAPSTAPTPSSEEPAAPVNSTITSPSNG